MTVVIDFDRRVDAEPDRLFNDRTIPARNSQGNVLSGSDLIRKAEDVGDFCAVEIETLSGNAVRKLQRKNTHANEIGSVDALETLRDDGPNAKQVRSLSGPIATGTGAVPPGPRR